jgi:caffeoyl-CoA O-methyltransferase
MAEPKSFLLSPELHQYIVSHCSPPDDAQRGLIAATAELGAVAGMQVSPEQGAFLTLLTRVLDVQLAVEVGTFTGYSALCIARGLASGGKLICCDVSDEWTSIGRPFWEKAGVADRIDLRIAPALETLAALSKEQSIDLAFIDADKPNYANYYEEILPRLKPRGVILVDNVLWSGRVLSDDNDDNTAAIKAFNDEIAADDRVDKVMLPISDGLTFITKRA